MLARWERVDAAKSVRVTDSMFMAAAQGIASAPSAYINAGINLLPPVTALRDIAVSVSLAVALQAHKKVPSSGLSPDQTKGLIRGKVWAPHYVPWRKIKSSAI
nr:malic enzyme-like NAD(P)-binding protein [Caballeronia glathei]